MGKHTDLKTNLTGRLSYSGRHMEFHSSVIGIGMIPCGDRERGDYRKDNTEERPNNDVHVR